MVECLLCIHEALGLILHPTEQIHSLETFWKFPHDPYPQTDGPSKLKATLTLMLRMLYPVKIHTDA